MTSVIVQTSSNLHQTLLIYWFNMMNCDHRLLLGLLRVSFHHFYILYLDIGYAIYHPIRDKVVLKSSVFAGGGSFEIYFVVSKRSLSGLQLTMARKVVNAVVAEQVSF